MATLRENVILVDGTIARVYLFRSDIPFFMGRAKKNLIEQAARIGKKTPYIKHLSARSIDIDDLIEICRTWSLGNVEKIIFLEDAEVCRGESLRKLLQYVTHPVRPTCLVLIWNNAKGNNQLEKAVQEGGGVVLSFSAPRLSQLPNWIRQQVQSRAKRITPSAVELLLHMVGPDISLLDMELDKLVLYVHDREDITENDVLSVSAAHCMYSVFDFVDRVGTRDMAEALQLLHVMLDGGESPTAVLALLARHFRLLWQVKDAIVSGRDIQAISRDLNLPVFVVRKLTDQSKSFSEESLRKLHKMLHDTDRNIKSLGIPAIYLLEQIIVEHV